MKTKNEILHLLSVYKPTAESKYGLTRIGIFGSVARGEQTDDSDVDVCYEGKAPSLLTLDLIQTELERMLGSRVDLVPRYPEIYWSGVMRMRDKIAHHYFEVDTDVVFRTVQEDVPKMKSVIDRMIADVEEIDNFSGNK